MVDTSDHASDTVNLLYVSRGISVLCISSTQVVYD